MHGSSQIDSLLHIFAVVVIHAAADVAHLLCFFCIDDRVVRLMYVSVVLCLKKRTISVNLIIVLYSVESQNVVGFKLFFFLFALNYRNPKLVHINKYASAHIMLHLMRTTFNNWHLHVSAMLDLFSSSCHANCWLHLQWQTFSIAANRLNLCFFFKLSFISLIVSFTVINFSIAWI